MGDPNDLPLDGRAREECFDIICQNISPHQWRNLGRKLGLSEPDLDANRIDTRSEGIREAYRRMLRTWAETHPTQVTINFIATALEDIYRVDLAERIRRVTTDNLGQNNNPIYEPAPNQTPNQRQVVPVPADNHLFQGFGRMTWFGCIFIVVAVAAYMMGGLMEFGREFTDALWESFNWHSLGRLFARFFTI